MIGCICVTKISVVTSYEHEEQEVTLLNEQCAVMLQENAEYLAELYIYRTVELLPNNIVRK